MYVYSPPFYTGNANLRLLLAWITTCTNEYLRQFSSRKVVVQYTLCLFMYGVYHNLYSLLAFFLLLWKSNTRQIRVIICRKLKERTRERKGKHEDNGSPSVSAVSVCYCSRLSLLRFFRIPSATPFSSRLDSAARSTEGCVCVRDCRCRLLFID